VFWATFREILITKISGHPDSPTTGTGPSNKDLWRENVWSLFRVTRLGEFLPIGLLYVVEIVVVAEPILPSTLLVNWTGLNRIRTQSLKFHHLSQWSADNVLDLSAFYWRSIRTELECSKIHLFIENNGVTHLTGVVLTTWPFEQPIRTTLVPDASEFTQISQSEQFVLWTKSRQLGAIRQRTGAGWYSHRTPIFS
jgi:hypothetical protein